ncbi:biotin-dependent carboxyltransferase family protein [Halalkalibacter sp. AB-rgal2]|uniref:5-oxoprolinase subunit C family protein n=1 Tax=Halalkalibacter sp. AB-rgal2 TaxID=3242695 RepID=UPI00359DCC65
MTIEIVKAGLLTTVQDTGRFGFQKAGVSIGGAMDINAIQIANVLVGNDENEAALEVTMTGPTMQFYETAMLAITGGDLSPKLNGTHVPLNRPILAKRGDELSFHQIKDGCRSYIAFAGGLQIKKVMNSYSTYLRAGIGGLNGRPLKKGDRLICKQRNRRSEGLYTLLTSQKRMVAQWSVSSHLCNNTNSNCIRVIRGRHYDSFSLESVQLLWNSSYTVTTEADRMGYRLNGSPLTLKKQQQMLSEPVSFGTIQVPGDGMPIILMADSQTVGGYPIIGQVAAVDRSKIAQMKAGDLLLFEEIDMNSAGYLFRKRQANLEELKASIYAKWVGGG